MLQNQIDLKITCTPNHRNRKFGLILSELLIILAIIAILASFAGIYYHNSLIETRIKNASNRLQNTIRQARLHAAIRNAHIVVCTTDLRQPALTCKSTQHWHKGWLVFSDFNQNQQRDKNELIIQVVPAQSGVTIHSQQKKRTLIFTRQGSYLSNTTIRICHQTKSTKGLALTIATTGMTRRYVIAASECLKQS